MWKARQLSKEDKNKTEREKENESEKKHVIPTTFVDRMPSPFIPVVLVDVVLSSDIRTKSLAWKSPKVPLEEMAILRFSSAFPGGKVLLKYKMKCTIILPGLEAKWNKTELINEK